MVHGTGMPTGQRRRTGDGTGPLRWVVEVSKLITERSGQSNRPFHAQEGAERQASAKGNFYFVPALLEECP